MARIRLRRRQRDPEGRMSVIEHLRELRRRLIVIVIIVCAGAIVAWIFYNPILDFLKHPYCSVPYTHRLGGVKGDGNSCKLLFYGPLDGFTTKLKISFIAGMILTAPLWLYQIWGFVTPGLRKNERKYSLIFIVVSTLLFLMGVALAYAVLTKGLNVLITTAGSGTSAALSITSYLNFVVLMLVVFGAAFELPLLVVMANLAGVLSGKLLKKSQRIGIFLIFVFAAIATPSTDPFTMCAMAVPMCVLFEGSVLFAVLHDRRKARRLDEPTPQDDVVSSIDPIPKPISPDDFRDTT
jgi:sec-independent protein translocase protein TatC